MSTLEQYPICNRWTGAVMFTAEISVTPDMLPSIKLGLAVKWAARERKSLRDAYLSCADLSGAYLRGADLRDAYLSCADLSGAKGADLAIAKTRILPEGSLIGWKKCENGVIVRLRIPEDSPRSHVFGRKCRAKFADVLEVIGSDEAWSKHDPKFVYRAGERVEAANWSADWQEECAGGIHFFITRAEAEAY